MTTFGSVARVPIEADDLKNIAEGGEPLIDPFLLDPKAVIKPAEKFTISINTVSRSMLDNYRSHYKAGEFGNDSFILMSGFGLGNAKSPTLKVHHIASIEGISKSAWREVWAENIATIEDYSVGDAKSRVFISLHTFCQNLEGSKPDDLKTTLGSILNFTGAMIPSLLPFTTLGKTAIAATDGINNLLNKTLTMPEQVLEMTFALYPSDGLAKGIPGEAPLQSGTYIFFAEETDFKSLKLLNDGTIQNSPPYIVVNVKRGITLAPDQLDTAEGAKILANFQPKYGYPVSTENNAGSFENLRELGRSLRLGQQTIRYFELKKKDAPSDQEKARLAELSQILKTSIPGFEPDVS